MANYTFNDYTGEEIENLLNKVANSTTGIDVINSILTNNGITSETNLYGAININKNDISTINTILTNNDITTSTNLSGLITTNINDIQTNKNNISSLNTILTNNGITASTNLLNKIETLQTFLGYEEGVNKMEDYTTDIELNGSKDWNIRKSANGILEMWFYHKGTTDGTGGVTTDATNNRAIFSYAFPSAHTFIDFPVVVASGYQSYNEKVYIGHTSSSKTNYAVYLCGLNGFSNSFGVYVYIIGRWK